MGAWHWEERARWFRRGKSSCQQPLIKGIPSLKLTYPLKIGLSKRNFHFPTIDFQGLLSYVSFKEVCWTSFWNFFFKPMDSHLQELKIALFGALLRQDLDYLEQCPSVPFVRFNPQGVPGSVDPRWFVAASVVDWKLWDYHFSGTAWCFRLFWGEQIGKKHI